MSLATFWAIFSQTHLVTLGTNFPVGSNFSRRRKNPFKILPKGSKKSLSD
jgi:hypothetical protein